MGDGGVIRQGFSDDLDTLANLFPRGAASLKRPSGERDGHQVAQGRLQQGLRILHRDQPSHLAQAPEEYIRRQTLVNAERFITPQMKEYESLILNAQERIAELESSLFHQVCKQTADAAVP